MLVNVADYGGGVIVQSNEPTGDPGMLWIDTGNGGVAKYFDQTKNNGAGEWIQIAPVIYYGDGEPNQNVGNDGDLYIRYLTT